MGPFPSQTIRRDIQQGREYDPQYGVPEGVITHCIPHRVWGYAYKAIGWQTPDYGGRQEPLLDRP